MHLKPGDDAPRFSIADASGEIVRLEDYIGKKILLVFQRFTTCPLCNLQTDRLTQYASIWQDKGLQILSFFTSSMESMDRFVAQWQPPFPVIPDPERTVYSLYNAETSVVKAVMGLGPWNPKSLRALTKNYPMASTKPNGSVTQIPADFLILPDLTIHTAHYGRSAADHMPIRSIVRFLEEEHPVPTA
jgi:thioredoxin-dependent peroxiredoxin